MAVVGNGDIASALPERPDLLFFASGVSNSATKEQNQFERERGLLLQQPRDAHLVYFSSLAVLWSDTPYFRHKRYMELLVKEHFPTSTIIRIGNISWGSNPHTLINYLKAHPKAPILRECRFIVDRAEFCYWLDRIPPWSCEMHIPGRRMSVQQVKEEYCNGDTNGHH